MSDDHDKHVERSRVAGGAGVALIARLGALVEAVSLFIFTWAYGSATLGLFAALWAIVKVSSAATEIALPVALQRMVPKQSMHDAATSVGAAIKISFIISVLFSAIVFFMAPWLSTVINAADADKVHLENIIRVYIWVLPFWTSVEVATASIRALRKFGPDVKVKIFYEQGLRLILGVAFALFGWMSYGLFLAHIFSALLSAGLSIHLVAKYYPIQTVFKASINGPIARELMHYGLPIMPSNVIKFLISELPVLVLNTMLPGAAGASAGAYYSIARRLSSILQSVRMTFEYVMAPMAAEKDGHGDHHLLQEMFAFATRLSLIFAILICVLLIVGRNDILATLSPDFAASSNAIIILCFGRMVEAATGPASAIIETLGHRMLPVLNAIAGLVALIIISAWLIPIYGVSGAAVAAATGLNITAILNAIQSWRLFNIKPFSRDLWRPLTMATFMSAAFLSATSSFTPPPPPYNFTMAFVFLVFTTAVLVRYGFKADDAAALGPLSKLARRKHSDRINALKEGQKTSSKL